MKFYHINADYIRYLKMFDHRVQDNYHNAENRHVKPYVGVILNIRNQAYYAPLASN